ncbi:MAG: exosortase A [Burkholderiaceae bacterium]|jgi:exosortase A|nr:exosortase A [Burkholderiaceae bacterium]
MSAIPADLPISSPWRRALPALLLTWALVLLLYRDTAVAMVQIWSRSDTFAHAFLVPPIALWLAWRKRETLVALTPSPQPWALLPMAAVGFMWLLGELVTVNAATQFALVAMLVLCVPAVLGLAVTRELLFPLGFLFFAVPFGEFLTPHMIAWTADATILALRWTGIPVYREGMNFVIPSGNWSVVEACSGVRYLIASFMVGTLFAYLNYRSTRRRLIFVGVSILVPIVANWMRAYMIVMLGHLSGNTIAVGVDHLIYGWVFFGVVIMIMFLIGARWAEPEADAAPKPAAAGYALRSTAGAAQYGAAVAAAALVIMLPQLANWGLQRAAVDTAVPQFVLPDRLGEWRASDTDLVQWRPHLLNPSVEARRTYVNEGQAVGVHIAYFRGQGPDRKLVSSQNFLVGSQDPGWNQVASGGHTLSVGGAPFRVRSAELLGAPQAGSAHRPALVVWRTYWVDGRFVPSDASAKLRGALAQLRGRGDDGAWIVFYADQGSSRESAAALTAFAAANLEAIESELRRTRDAR